MYLKHDKNTVLKKGLGLLCSKGYNDLGVEEICQVTGMTKGAFYNAFKSKEQFLRDAIQLYQQNNLKRIHTELSKYPSKSAYDQLLLFYMNMLKAQPEVGFNGCFINNIMSEMGTQSEAVAHDSSQAFLTFIQAIEPRVKEAQKQGNLPAHIPSRRLAELLHSTFYGVLTIARSTQDYKQAITILKLLFQNLNKEKK